MRIKEVCELTGLTKKAIYYYEKKEIISPKFMSNGYREFDNEDIKRLKKIYILKSLGLSITNIKEILDSKISKEKLRQCITKKSLEEEISKNESDLLKKLLEGEDIDKILREIEDLNSKKTIKERILNMFPGFYGRFLIIHFSRFLNDPIRSDDQIKAYKEIVEFLDRVEAFKIRDEKMEELEIEKEENLDNMDEFIIENSDFIKDYINFKESDEYESSFLKEIMEAMRNFTKESGYNEIFIPAMRRLSPSYNNYYKKLLASNEVFLKKYPELK
ncbi:MAG: MerR family transcriptional regulator [Peptoniphilaceae bacterium]